MAGLVAGFVAGIVAESIVRSVAGLQRGSVVEVMVGLWEGAWRGQRLFLHGFVHAQRRTGAEQWVLARSCHAHVSGLTSIYV